MFLNFLEALRLRGSVRHTLHLNKRALCVTEYCNFWSFRRVSRRLHCQAHALSLFVMFQAQLPFLTFAVFCHPETLRILRIIWSSLLLCKSCSLNVSSSFPVYYQQQKETRQQLQHFGNLLSYITYFIVHQFCFPRNRPRFLPLPNNDPISSSF